MKKTANKKNLIPVVTELLPKHFRAFIDDVDFDKESKMLTIEMSKKAYGDGWAYSAEYIKNTKCFWSNSNRFDDEFNALIKDIFAEFNGINVIHIQICAD